MLFETKDEQIARLCAEARAQGLAEAIVDEIGRERARGMRDKAKQVVNNMLFKDYPAAEICSIVAIDTKTLKEYCKEMHFLNLPEGLE